MAENQNQGSNDQRNDQQRDKHDARGVSVAPFTVECGDNKNSIIQVSTIKQQFQGRWERGNVGPAQGIILGFLPNVIPGVQLTVNPRESKVTIHDPLGDDQALCKQIERAMNEGFPIRNAFGNRVGKRTEDRDQKLDQHELKTLLLEIARGVHCEDIAAKRYHVIKGRVPTEQELSSFPGEELYDVASNNPRKPKFKKDAAEWEQKMERMQTELGV